MMNKNDEMTNLQKTKAIFNAKAFKDMYRWSKCAHKAIVFFTLASIVSTLLSLATTLVTRNLIDGATTGKLSVL